MMTIADQYRREGFEEGYREGYQLGYQEGYREGRLEVFQLLATHFLHHGLDLDEFVQCTDFNLQDLAYLLSAPRSFSRSLPSPVDRLS